MRLYRGERSKGVPGVFHLSPSAVADGCSACACQASVFAHLSQDIALQDQVYEKACHLASHA